MVTLLISCGCDPNENSAGFHKYPALHNAVVGQCIDAAKILIACGARVTEELMDEAAKSGNLEMLKLLLESGYSLAARDDGTTRWTSRLFSAVESGNISLVEYMLQNGARIDQLGSHRRTSVIHCASRAEDLAMVKYLFERAPDPMIAFTEDDGPNEVCDGKTAVEGAVCSYRHGELGLEIGEYLLSHMPPDIPNQILLGMAAGFVRVGQTEMAERVIAKASGPLAHARAKSENSLLGVVIEERNEQMLRTLLDRGMSPGAQDKEGYAPLHVASSSNSDGTVEPLLQHGADINATTALGMTPVHVSVYRGNLETLSVLLKHQPDLTIRADDGSTPLVAAGCSGQLGAARLLLDHECDINGSNTNGESILHYAVIYGDKELARALLDRGIDSSIMSRRGGTALHCAAYKGDFELAEILLHSGAATSLAYEYSKQGCTPPEIRSLSDVLPWNQPIIRRKTGPRYWKAMHSAALPGSVGLLSLLIASG